MIAIRTDRELECPGVDAGLRARGLELVTLPQGISEERLIAEVARADLLLTCYTPITRRVIEAGSRLRGGFRMPVLGFDPYVNGEAMARAGVKKCDQLSDLLPLLSDLRFSSAGRRRTSNIQSNIAEGFILWRHAPDPRCLCPSHLP